MHLNYKERKRRRFVEQQCLDIVKRMSHLRSQNLLYQHLSVQARRAKSTRGNWGAPPEIFINATSSCDRRRRLTNSAMLVLGFASTQSKNDLAERFQFSRQTVMRVREVRAQTIVNHEHTTYRTLVVTTSVSKSYLHEANS